MLVELVANPGNLVSREDLHKKLWPADTFVDFDVGLNSAIRKLRQALNDDAENPRYIETLAKRGYRFMAPVIDTGTMAPTQGSQPVSDGVSSVDISSDTNGSSAGRAHAAAIGSKQWVWIASALVVIAIAAGFIFWRTRPPAVPIVEAVTQLTDDGEPKPYASKIVTDGVRVYFNEGTRGSLKIAQVAVTGAVPSPSFRPVLPI